MLHNTMYLRVVSVFPGGGISYSGENSNAKTMIPFSLVVNHRELGITYWENIINFQIKHIPFEYLT